MAEHFTVNSIVGLSNVLFFMVVQIFFFWFIASREIDHVVHEKAEILMLIRDNLRRQHLNDVAEALDATLVSKKRQRAAEARARERERSQLNLDLVIRWLIPGVTVVALVLIGFLLYNRSQGWALEHAHKVGLGLVLLAYITEILIFLTIVSNYIMVSDTDILRELTGLKAQPI